MVYVVKPLSEVGGWLKNLRYMLQEVGGPNIARQVENFSKYLQTLQSAMVGLSICYVVYTETMRLATYCYPHGAGGETDKDPGQGLPAHKW